ncbi:MAG: patatin-like phospholipase family protein [Holosporales bacterium]|nr:patatin-like phospholipase family protein [Holosporales bacterium]
MRTSHSDGALETLPSRQMVPYVPHNRGGNTPIPEEGEAPAEAGTFFIQIVHFGPNPGSMLLPGHMRPEVKIPLTISFCEDGEIRGTIPLQATTTIETILGRTVQHAGLPERAPSTRRAHYGSNPGSILLRRHVQPEVRVPFVVFSFDGGGIRGLIPAYFMTFLEANLEMRTHQFVDLLAGTSTGGLLALGLATPDENGQNARYHARDILHLYKTRGPTIFTKRFANFGGLRNAAYESESFEGVLQELFGDIPLSGSLTRTLITSYDTERSKPVVFKSEKARQNPQYDFAMRDTARGTSAAPTYFPPAEAFSRADQYGDHMRICAIDGGMFANNPSMCAFSEVLHHYGDLVDVLLVSVGTGRATVPLPYVEARDMGLIGWAKRLAGIAIDGPAIAVDYQLRQISQSFGGHLRYFRIQTELQRENAAMDDVSPQNLATLEHRAEEMVRSSSVSRVLSLLRSLPPQEERQAFLQRRLAARNTQ